MTADAMAGEGGAESLAIGGLSRGDGEASGLFFNGSSSTCLARLEGRMVSGGSASSSMNTNSRVVTGVRVDGGSG